MARLSSREKFFECFASTGVYAPLLAKNLKRGRQKSLLGHDVRCWIGSDKGRLLQ